jgi:GTPase
MKFQVMLSVALFSSGTVAIENQCSRKGRRQTKIMKFDRGEQLSEGVQYVKTSCSPELQHLNPTAFFERLEPISDTSVGKEMEPILTSLSSRLLTDVDGKIVDRCLLIGVESVRTNLFESFQELCNLSAQAGLSVVSCESQKSGSPNDDQIFGNGKIMQIASQLLLHSIETVVFDGELSPIQLRNLEESLIQELPTGKKSVKVIDKTSIILDIMIRNCQSKESSMQAELAMAIYRLPRMTPMWAKLAKTSEHHLSIGSRGPGGKNLDLDFKQMRKRISYLTKTLEDVRCIRTAQRHYRKSRGIPTIAVVGYIGSGKSSLQNALTCVAPSGCKIDESDSPFKTLEPVIRRISVPKQEKLAHSKSKPNLSVSRSACPDFLLVDTMSLIDKLPACIMTAFKMNFDELENADIIVNVCDVSNPLWNEQQESVLTTLNGFESLANKPIITLWNKLDRFSESDIRKIQGEASRRRHTVAVSAHTTLGFDDMLRCFNEVMVEKLMSEVKGTLSYSPQNLALLSKLQQSSSFDVLEYTNDGIKLIGKIPLHFAAQFSQSVVAVKVKAKAAKSALLRAFAF